MGCCKKLTDMFLLGMVSHVWFHLDSNDLLNTPYPIPKHLFQMWV